MGKEGEGRRGGGRADENKGERKENRKGRGGEGRGRETAGREANEKSMKAVGWEDLFVMKIISHNRNIIDEWRESI